jgi:hypothetical protein
VLEKMKKDGVLDNYKHPNVEKYPNQYLYVIELGGYIHYIPYVFDDNALKNPDNFLAEFISASLTA